MVISICGWMPTGRNPEKPRCNHVSMVHVQGPNSCPPLWSLAEDNATRFIPLKMVMPKVAARIEKPDDILGLRVYRF